MIRNYFNGKAAIWDDRFAEKDNQKLDSMVEKMELKPGMNILDIGSGTGVLAPFLIRKIGQGRLIALDIAEKMLGKSKEKLRDERIHRVQGDIMDAPFSAIVFDAVVCYSVFPHFRDKIRALEEIRRVLKDGGSIYIAHTSGREFINKIHSNIPGMKDHKLPDAAEMFMILREQRFSHIEVDDNPESYLARAIKKAV